MENNKKRIIAVIAIVASMSIMMGVVTGCGKKTEEDKAPVKTEIATDAKGTPTVVQGTAPNGTPIENSTYPDGTEVEFATTAKGEYATEADGSYIINYPETAPVGNQNNSSSESSVNTQQNSDKNNSSTVENKKEDSNKEENKKEDNKKEEDKKEDNKKEESKKEDNKNNSSSSSQSTSKPDNSSSSNTNNNSSSTATPPTDKGDANADINAGAYKVGDKIKVSYYLQSNVKFCGIQCNINYDSTALKLNSDSIDMSKLAGPMCNPDAENQIRFLSSAASAVNDFTKEKLLFSCEFEVIKTTNGDVTINVVDILDDNVLSISNDQYKITAKVEKL